MSARAPLTRSLDVLEALLRSLDTAPKASANEGRDGKGAANGDAETPDSLGLHAVRLILADKADVVGHWLLVGDCACVVDTDVRHGDGKLLLSLGAASLGWEALAGESRHGLSGCCGHHSKSDQHSDVCSNSNKEGQKPIVV
jgi:hypothetical protein